VISVQNSRRQTSANSLLLSNASRGIKAELLLTPPSKWALRAGTPIEARNFETTQHIDRWVADISSTINAPYKMPNLGHHSTGIWRKRKRNLLICKWCAKTCVGPILLNSSKFSASRPLLPAHSFSATMASTSSTYCLGTVVSIKSWRLKICLLVQ